MYDQYGEEGVKAADQMGDNAPHGFGGGMPHGFHSGSPHMSATDAERIFEAFFGGNDPFGGGMRGGPGPGIRFSTGGPGGGMGHDPFGMLGGMGGIGGRPGSFSHPGLGGMGGMGGGHPGFGMPRQQQERRPRYDAIHNGTVVSLKGLVSRPERNGDRGEIQGYDPNSGRYVVVLEDTDETMSVKPSNILQHVHVHLHGLESRPELNGKQGTIIAWNPHNERYNIYVMSVSKVISLKASSVVLEEGTVGQISGLVAKPELNGRWGTIKKWNRETERYDIQLSADKIMRVKMENVLV
jgi:hypothetical protein